MKKYKWGRYSMLENDEGEWVRYDEYLLEKSNDPKALTDCKNKCKLFGQKINELHHELKKLKGQI